MDENFDVISWYKYGVDFFRTHCHSDHTDRRPELGQRKKKKLDTSIKIKPSL